MPRPALMNYVLQHISDNAWGLHRKLLVFRYSLLRLRGRMLSSCLLDGDMESICTITIDNCSTYYVFAKSLIDHYEPKGLLLLHN